MGNSDLQTELIVAASPGRERDAESGIYYYRARYYDPKIGRFISEDPIRFDADINFYSYVRNQPTRLVDPFGLVDLNLFKDSLRLRAGADRFNDDRAFTVAGHGNSKILLDEYTGQRLTAAQLAQRIRRSLAWKKKNKRVLVLGCNVGTGRNSLGQRLANNLGVPVTAVSGGFVYWDPDILTNGGWYPDPNEGGEWKTFNPSPDLPRPSPSPALIP
jgi:RHS repeat-associated protein